MGLLYWVPGKQGSSTLTYKAPRSLLFGTAEQSCTTRHPWVGLHFWQPALYFGSYHNLNCLIWLLTSTYHCLKILSSSVSYEVVTFELAVSDVDKHQWTVPRFGGTTSINTTTVATLVNIGVSSSSDSHLPNSICLLALFIWIIYIYRRCGQNDNVVIFFVTIPV